MLSSSILRIGVIRQSSDRNTTENRMHHASMTVVYRCILWILWFVVTLVKLDLFFRKEQNLDLVSKKSMWKIIFRKNKNI